MSAVEQFPYCDRNPASGGLDLMPDLPIILPSVLQPIWRGIGWTAMRPSVYCHIRWAFNLASPGTPKRRQSLLLEHWAHVHPRGIVVEVEVGNLPLQCLAMAWANSDQVPFLLGQFNFFQAFDVFFFRKRGVFETVASKHCEFAAISVHSGYAITACEVAGRKADPFRGWLPEREARSPKADPVRACSKLCGGGTVRSAGGACFRSGDPVVE